VRGWAAPSSSGGVEAAGVEGGYGDDDNGELDFSDFGAKKKDS